MADLRDEDGEPRGPRSFEEDVPCIRCLGSTGRAETDPDPDNGLCGLCARFLDGKSEVDPRPSISWEKKPDAKTG